MRRAWSPARALAIAIGGVAGASLRWAVLTSTSPAPGSFPWSVMLLNLVGSVLLGVALAEEWSHPSARLLLHDIAGIGFCGGLTTFSTYAVEVVELSRAGHTATAIAYGLASVVAAVAGVVIGAAGLRRVRALRLPLEEQP
jgi:fluoride exporter